MHDMTQPRYLVLDTASLYFRAFYGVPDTIRAPDGSPTNAVRGLLDFISRLVTDHQPTNFIAAWDDDWRPDFRVQAIPTYKAHRVAEEAAGTDVEEVPDALGPQVDLIVEVLRLAGLCRIGVPGFEADDVIGSVVTQTDSPCFVVTGDRDLFQLVNDRQPVRVLYTAAKGVGNAEIIDEAAVRDRYGVEASQYADYALLRGDASDGLPGVKGIGEKTAAALLSQFDGLDEIIAAVANGSSGIKAAAARSIAASSDYIAAARLVVPVQRDLPVNLTDCALPQAPTDRVGLVRFAQRWGLENAVTRLAEALNWEPLFDAQ